MSKTPSDKELITWYLEMTSPDDFKSTPFFQPKARVEILSHQKGDNEHWLPAKEEVNRWFYAQVGKKWQWTDRANWSDEQWVEYVNDNNLITGVGYLAQDEIGYFELQQQNQGRAIGLPRLGRRQHAGQWQHRQGQQRGHGYGDRLKHPPDYAEHSHKTDRGHIAAVAGGQQQQCGTDREHRPHNNQPFLFHYPGTPPQEPPGQSDAADIFASSCPRPPAL